MSEYVCDACGSAIMDDGYCLCTADYRAPKSLSRWGSLADLLECGKSKVRNQLNRFRGKQ